MSNNQDKLKLIELLQEIDKLVLSNIDLKGYCLLVVDMNDKIEFVYHADNATVLQDSFKAIIDNMKNEEN